MKPQPVVVTTICSECGLAWEAHGDKPTTSDCIRLLKAELAKRPSVTIYPHYPNWWYTQYQGAQYQGAPWSYTTQVTSISNCSPTVDYKTPAVTVSCVAVTN